MSRARLGVAGLACLALAVVVYPTATDPADGILAAFGRSMGGSRVMLIDALFLRAEGQRKAGRIEEAAALYQTVLDLDPANEPATSFLANLYVSVLLRQEPDPVLRHKWWLEVRALLDQALRRRPQSAFLHAQTAAILLQEIRPGGALADRPEAEVDAAAWDALRHLQQATRGAADIPRLGKTHLVSLALLAPELAVRALTDGDRAAFAEAVAIGREALAVRAAPLADTRLQDDLEASLGSILEAGLDAAVAVRDARLGTASRADARRRIARCRELVPRWPLADQLEALLAQ